MRMLFLLLFAFLSSATAQDARGAAASFDSRGHGIVSVLDALRLNTAATPTPPAAPVSQSLKPIVLTISGVHPGELGAGLEFRHILSLWNWLFPDKEPDEEKIRADLNVMRMELLDAFPQGGPGEPHENYVETALRAAVERHQMNVDIEGFSWSRDPGDTRVSVARLVETLKELKIRAEGRPLHLVTHSWGTVLAHEALFQLAFAGTPMEIEGIVTMGSPLVPVNLVLRIFGDVERVVERLQKRVTRPEGVAYWTNLYSENDPFAGTIKAADDNIRVDTQVDLYEARLKEFLRQGAPAARVKADLRALKNGLGWHVAYTRSFKAKFEVLGEDVEWPICQEHLGNILPHVVETRP